MSDPFEGRPFPRGVLIGAALLIGFVIAAAAMVRLTGVGGSDMPIAPIAESRQLVFVEHGDGTTSVNVPDEGTIAVLESGVDGFVLGVMRGMVRERNSHDVSHDQPYLLTLREDGRLLFEDPATGRLIDLRAFGVTNAGSFAQLLRAEPRPDAEHGQ